MTRPYNNDWKKEATARLEAMIAALPAKGAFQSAVDKEVAAIKEGMDKSWDEHMDRFYGPGRPQDPMGLVNIVERQEPIRYYQDEACPPDTMYYVDPKSFVRIEASEALAEEEWGEDDKTFLVSPTGGRKEVKEARYSLIPTEALRALAEVYGRGAAKYEDHNWRRGYDFTASLDALQRHVEAFRSGQNIDPESGQPHIIHAAWHCFALHVFSNDDRYSRYDDRLPWEQH